MSDRITKHVSAMKDYGRKPYLVTKDAVPIGEKADYRYMMDTTWHKAQDNEQIIVQSVKKKPYKNSDYQTMEQAGDFFQPFIFPDMAWRADWKFPEFKSPNISWDVRNPNPLPANEPMTPEEEREEKISRSLTWIQYPPTVSPSGSYTVIVSNSYTIKNKIIGGRLQGTTRKFYPSEIYLKAKDGGAIGLSVINIDKRETTTWATLAASSYASGEYYLIATDGLGNYIDTIVVCGLDCSGQPETIGQDDSIVLSVKGGKTPISWSATEVEDSRGFTLTPSGSDTHLATISTDATASGSVSITVTDDGGETCTFIIRCISGRWVCDTTAPNPTLASLLADAITWASTVSGTDVYIGEWYFESSAARMAVWGDSDYFGDDYVVLGGGYQEFYSDGNMVTCKKILLIHSGIGVPSQIIGGMTLVIGSTVLNPTTYQTNCRWVAIPQ